MIFISLWTISCQTENSLKNETKDISNEWTFPVIIDTIEFRTEDLNTTWISRANYNLLYIGLPKDTIKNNDRIRFIQPPPPPPGSGIKKYKKEFKNPLDGYYIDWLSERTYKSWNEVTIDIRIDTTTSIRKDVLQVERKSPYLRNYPVILTNIETDTIQITYGNYLPLIMEAKDSSDKWRPIEEERIYMCGVGIGSIILPPKQIALTSVIVFEGNYKTDLRLKIGQNYSNTFNGTINYRQFESMFDNNGNYKQEYLNEQKKKK